MADPTPQEMLSAYLAAEKQAASAGVAEVRISDRDTKFLSLTEIRAGIAYWQRQVNRAAGDPGFAVANFS